MGVIIVLCVGTLASWATGIRDSTQLDPRLVCKFIRHRVGKRRVITITKIGARPRQHFLIQRSDSLTKIVFYIRESFHSLTRYTQQQLT